MVEVDLNALHAKGQQMLRQYQANQFTTGALESIAFDNTTAPTPNTGMNQYNLDEAIRKMSQEALKDYDMRSGFPVAPVVPTVPSGPSGPGNPSGPSNPSGTPNLNTTPNPQSPRNPNDSQRDEYLEYMKEKGMRSAEGAMRGFFGQFFGAEAGSALAQWAISQIALGYDADTIIMQMRFGSSTVATTDAMYVPKEIRDLYDKRFPAMALRDENDAPLSEAQYVQQESGLRAIIDKTGLGAYVTAQEALGKDPITTLIANNVSVAEFAGRAEEAEDMYYNSNPETVAMLKRDYKWDKADFMAAMVDPTFMATSSLAEAKRAYNASKLTGMSQRVLGTTSFDKDLSRSLLNQNVQEREVAAQLGQFAGLAGSTISSDAMTGTELGEGIWGSGKARADLRRENEKRRSQFSGTTGSMINAAGNTSLGSVYTT